MTEPTIVTAWKNRLKEIEFNPSSMSRIALNTLKELHDGKIEVIDTSTPFTYSILSSAVNVSAFIDEAVALNRKQYPVEAITEEDLYLHMSDRDYLNRFAIPSTANFKFVFDKLELLSTLVEDPELGIRKLIIPRNTRVTVNNMTFTLLYPIEIRQLKHGGIQVVYNNNIKSPLKNLKTNIIEYDIYDDGEVEWLAFDVELEQLTITTLFGDTNLIKAPEMNIILNDNFYFIRVFIEDEYGNWNEIYTTHTDQVYDITKLTAVVRVTTGNVNVRIPQIYLSQGMVNGRLRYDLYQTKANINADLSVYPVNQFKTEFVPDIFDLPSTIYSAPLRGFKTLTIFSQDITTGGNDPMTFEELREAVINNSVGLQEIPITPTQAQTSLSRAGYEIVTNVDNITGRSMLATRPLPKPNNEHLVTPASASVESVLISEKQAREMNSVHSNFRSVTITPNTLFESKSGVMKMVPDAKIKAILDMSPELIANEVSTNKYFYTPFHYVLHFQAERFISKPYYLDAPSIKHKVFVSDNDKTLMQVSINEYEIHRTDTGYKLLISVKSDDNYKKIDDNEVFVQLAFKPTKEKDYAYLNGTLLGLNDEDERVFEFDLSTNFYIDTSDEIYFSKFKMYTMEEQSIPSVLDNEFEVLFCTSGDVPENWEPDEVDKKLGKFLLPEVIYGISNERIGIKFGTPLQNLWARCRSIISAEDYLRYSTDVPLTYEEDVYDIDPVTGSSVQVINGKVVHQIRHHKGDPVLDESGAVIYKFKQGDPVLDSKGRPTFNNEYSLIRQMDILLVEGEYWFANDTVTDEYKKELTNTLIDWITDGLAKISKNLLEQTEVYFYPKSTVGQIDTMINNSVRSYIESGQSFNVKLYVNKIVYDNIELRNKLTQSTIRVISNELSKVTVNKSDIISALKIAYGDDVIGFDLTGLGGTTNVDTITVLNEAQRCSIRKRLVAQADAKLVVEEDVTCVFQLHDKKLLDD